MNCPVCSIAMRVSERDGVDIDYCPQCRGVWLDRGELEKIIAGVESQQSRGRDEQDEDEDRQGGRRAGQYRDDDSRQEGDYRREGESKYGGKRKEGFFSNLFDMFGD